MILVRSKFSEKTGQRQSGLLYILFSEENAVWSEIITAGRERLRDMSDRGDDDGTLGKSSGRALAEKTQQFPDEQKSTRPV